jgi:hypothetical protein
MFTKGYFHKLLNSLVTVRWTSALYKKGGQQDKPREQHTMR